MDLYWEHTEVLVYSFRECSSSTHGFMCPDRLTQRHILVLFNHLPLRDGEFLSLIHRAKKEIRFYSAIPKSSDHDQKAPNIYGSWRRTTTFKIGLSNASFCEPQLVTHFKLKFILNLRKCHKICLIWAELLGTTNILYFKNLGVFAIQAIQVPLTALLFLKLQCWNKCIHQLQ